MDTYLLYKLIRRGGMLLPLNTEIMSKIHTLLMVAGVFVLIVALFTGSFDQKDDPQPKPQPEPVDQEQVLSRDLDDWLYSRGG